MLVNKLLPTMDWQSVREKIEQTYHYDVIGMLPLNEALIRLGSRKLFAMQSPNHPWTAELNAIADRLPEIFTASES